MAIVFTEGLAEFNWIDELVLEVPAQHSIPIRAVMLVIQFLGNDYLLCSVVGYPCPSLGEISSTQL